jgi:nucleotide-binding universal stress UspA family protein
MVVAAEHLCFAEGEKNMFKRILVPLDGSLRAERAIPVAARIANDSDGTVVLLQVVGLPVSYSMSLYGSYMAQTPVFTKELLNAELAKAKFYLAGVLQSDHLLGIKVETQALVGGAAATILDVASEQHIDLIVMCSHGDTGVKRWVLGSVAQQVSRHSPVPVLVLREKGTEPTSSYPDPLHPLRSIIGLVALDGSKLAEAALAPAAQLVAALAAPARGTLLLTRVVPISAPESEVHALDQARAYLSQVADHLREGLAAELKLSVSVSVGVGKDVAETLIRAAEYSEDAEGRRLTGNCDLMVMATHGRGGLERWAMGSVTERVLGATKLPLLVVHPCVPSSSESKSSTQDLPGNFVHAS